MINTGVVRNRNLYYIILKTKLESFKFEIPGIILLHQLRVSPRAATLSAKTIQGHTRIRYVYENDVILIRTLQITMIFHFSPDSPVTTEVFYSKI